MSTVVFSATISTSSKASASTDRVVVPKSVFWLIVLLLTVKVLNPIYSKEIEYVPLDTLTL